MEETIDVARRKQEPLAVIGFACRLPGSCNNPKAFWDFLERGGIASQNTPATRFDISTHYDGSRKDHTMASPGGMFIDANPADIDASFFKLSRTEAMAMDPQQRQLLEVVYEGLENSGMTLEMLDGAPVGCFVASYASDYADIQSRDPEDRSNGAAVGTGRAMLSNRISHFLNVRGPSLTVDTACSGSLVGVDLANRYLQTREITGAIVAAANLYLSPEHVMDPVSRNGTASGSGFCHTFDEKADGYMKAEAINMVFVKRLDDALRDNDPIRAIIRGSATGSDGWTAGIASPNSAAQAETIRQAYANAHITDLSATSYIECHGTGTKAGDPIEIDAVASVFGSMGAPGLGLRIGSVKSNIGHSEPAAGVSALIKVALALEHGVIPGNPTFVTPNPSINFNASRLRTSRNAMQWDIAPSLRRAGINSFGFGGTNAHVIMDCGRQTSGHVSSYIEDEDSLFEDDLVCDRPYVLPLSANDELSLRNYVTLLHKHLVNPAVRVEMRDLAYTLSEKRARHFYRGFVVANGCEMIRNIDEVRKSSSVPRIGLVFTGQGAQWPQMGSNLVASFPVARDCLERLSAILKGLADGPEWDLLNELTQPRTSECYRHPELSQTLVTALQLGILAVLQDCDVPYQAVVGHSSGEIAAAVAAGLLTPSEAIQIAYFRGKATGNGPQTSVGMMAAGIGVSEAMEYLQYAPDVQVACVNSPQSVTLSGDGTQLQDLESRLKQDGHFARMLQVDAAYHSKYMNEVAGVYRQLLEDKCRWECIDDAKATLYSTVTGTVVGSHLTAAYWEQNMVSPVRFDSAMKEMLTGSTAPDLLIELGPTGALAGPIKQIRKALKAEVEYISAWERGPTADQAFCRLAGYLFARGASINLQKFNGDFREDGPRFIVDLPNYSWNHTTKYWHESQASKDWRFRKFRHHDLLGSKILGVPWTQPVWRKRLRVSELSWLADHKLGDTIVFPAAGYLAMAIEAIYQMEKCAGCVQAHVGISGITYHLRQIRFLKAMVIEGGNESTNVLSTLTVHSGTKRKWYLFRILTQDGDITTEHCTGLISIADQKLLMADRSVIEPLRYPQPGSIWYKTMRDVGLNFGPSFQKQKFIEAVAGSRDVRSLLDLSDPKSNYQQSAYIIHPASIDVCFQSVTASIWAGMRSTATMRLVPSAIDEIIIPSRACPVEAAMAKASSTFDDVGNPKDPKSYRSGVCVCDPDTGEVVFKMHGLRCLDLEPEKAPNGDHLYCRSIWTPDISTLTSGQFGNMAFFPEKGTTSELNKLLDAFALWKPEVRVLEILSSHLSESSWLCSTRATDFDRTLCSRLSLWLTSHKALSEATSKYGFLRNTVVRKIELGACPLPEEEYDLILLSSASPTEIPPHWIAQLRQSLKSGRGSYLLVTRDNFEETPESPDSAVSLTLSPPSCSGSVPTSPPTNMAGAAIWPGIPHSQDLGDFHAHGKLELFRFVEQGDVHASVRTRLSCLGWDISEHLNTCSDIPPGSTVLILDEIRTPVLGSITIEWWKTLKELLSRNCRILWNTRNCQIQASNPNGGIIHGLFRSIRNEDPSAALMTLDVDSTTSEEFIHAIDGLLQRLQSLDGIESMDMEYAFRHGILHVERVIPDKRLNEQEKSNNHGGYPTESSLFQHPNCVRLQSHQIGTLDSLIYSEVEAQEYPTAVPSGSVELEIHAVALNFKDVVICLGVVPGDEKLLGWDGAGVIRRVGEQGGSFHVGQRVLTNKKGSLANRMICRIDQIFPLPDDVSFEDATTLNTVYSTALYSLTRITRTCRGQSVLIHSAAGGLGLAAVQICNYLGAEVFATVGSEEKRQYLVDVCRIPSDRIFSSRSSEFAPSIMNATGGKGVDVILNSLSGELLHAGWDCVATGGTFVELGKKDILDGERVSMAPFDRTAAFCSVDMSHSSISADLKQRLLEETFELLRSGHIKPVISKVYSFAHAVDAFRHLSTGNSIGKVVISRECSAQDTTVPISPVKPKMHLREDASYLMVGGLKGLCGSLAVYLAQQGAKNLLILSRSGYEDEKSQATIADIKSLGAGVDLVIGDVTNEEDVQRAFLSASRPVRGIIHGAMVLRDKLWTSMTHAQFLEALAPKVRGTWTLHHVTRKLNIPLDFFTLLSSICGVVGQKGQANYSAANSFLDSFGSYRRSLGLPACAVDLGVVEDVGYIDGRESLARRLHAQGWVPINERALHKILYYSILQQGNRPINPDSSAQLITGIPVPLPAGSPAQRDPRFSPLRLSGSGLDDGSISSHSVHSAVAMLRNAWNTGDNIGDQSELMGVLIDTANQKLMRSLGMADEMDPFRPLATYGIDSLVALDFKNWTRMELGVQVATLDIVGAKTLQSLCQHIMRKGFSLASRS
ncbi:polyketide synthase [Lentithecium fluviatile CBS 122367]|uniref:Polyketide synthase n=1 Tax=Lentithecium fluviatile CBS 122367 TaxID=1168545 RepID=A0A6G1INN0_9PLEO|nr:polyketide synthase [Lentithecium fluviatile CBS 122367]